MSQQVLEVHYSLKDIRKHLTLTLKPLQPPKRSDLPKAESEFDSNFVSPFPLTTIEQFDHMEEQIATDIPFLGLLVSV